MEKEIRRNELIHSFFYLNLKNIYYYIKMPTHDIKKIYQTYSSDSKVKDDIKLLKNEI